MKIQPKPLKDEEKVIFINRFLKNEELIVDIPDRRERINWLIATWEQHNMPKLAKSRKDKENDETVEK